MRRTATPILMLLLLWGNAGAKDVAVKIADLPEKFRSFDVWGLEFSPDAHALAVGINNTINIWDWRRKHIETTLAPPHGANPPTCADPLQYSQDGSLVGVCVGRAAGDVYVRIWDAMNFSVARDILAMGPGTATAFTFSPDGLGLLYVVNSAQPIEHLFVEGIRNPQSGFKLTLPDFGPVAAVMSPGGDLAAITGSLLVRPAGVTDNAERILKSRFEPRVYIVDMRQKKVIKEIIANAVGPLTWSVDSLRIAVAGAQRVEIFDVQSGVVRVSEFVANSGNMNVLFTPDNKYFIESDFDALGNGLGVKIWDSAHHQLLQHLKGNVGSIAVTRDGKYLAVGMSGHTAIFQLN